MGILGDTFDRITGNAKRIINNPTDYRNYGNLLTNSLSMGQVDAFNTKAGKNSKGGGSPLATGVYNPNNGGIPPELTITGKDAGQVQAGMEGLNLGRILTGQDIYQTGGQVQDAIRRSQGLVEGNNPVVSEMTGQRNAAVARTANEMAKAGVRGGASVAAQQQVGNAMDKQIASTAHQMYTQNLQNHLKTLSGVQQAQVSPMYTNQDMYLAATTPEYKRKESNGVLSGLMDSLFG